VSSEREREEFGQTEAISLRVYDRKKKRAGIYVCVCVWKIAREGAGERRSVCVRKFVLVCVCVCVYVCACVCVCMCV